MAKSYQIGYDKTYCYENSTVLKNKLNITDKEQLSKVESEVTFHRSIQIQDKPVKGNLDYEHLRNIHKVLFQDIYSWAGELRTIDIAKDNMFCKPAFLESYGEDIFKSIKKNNYFIGADQDSFAKKAAELTGDINALHPFREGNGRSQRMFLRYLANVAGYDVQFSKVPYDEIIQASIESMQCDYSRYTRIYMENSIQLNYSEQSHFITNLNSEIITGIFEEYKIDCIKNEIHKAGFKATKTLIGDLKIINDTFGKMHSVNEIKQLHEHKNELSPDQAEFIDKVAKDFKNQELERVKEINFDMEQ